MKTSWKTFICVAALSICATSLRADTTYTEVPTANITDEGTVTFNLSADGQYIGTLSAAGLAKQGNNTLTLFGQNTLSGDITVSAGTLRLAAQPRDLDGIAFDFDTTVGGTIVTNGDGEISNWTDAYNGSLSLQFWGTGSSDTVYSAAVVPELVTDDSIFGGKPVLHAAQLQAYTWSSSYNSVEATTFMVMRFVGNDKWTTLASAKYNSNNNGILGRNNGGDIVARTGASGSLWRNGSSGCPVNVNEDNVIAHTGVMSKSGLAFGCAWLEQYWGEILRFSSSLTDDQRSTVETYLMNKWGVNSTAWAPGYSEAAVSVAADATLDLTTTTPAFKSLSLASGAIVAVDELPADGILATTTDGVTITDTPKLYVGGVEVTDVTLSASGNNLVAVRPTAEYNVEAGVSSKVAAIHSAHLGSFTKTGDGTLYLVGTNAFTAPVTVSAGTLKLAAANELGNVLYDFDATKTSTVTTDGEEAFIWNDANGGTISLVNSRTEPTMTTIDGKPFLTSSGMQLIPNSGSAWISNPNMSFVVWNVASGNSWQTLMGDSSSAANSKYYVGKRNEGDTSYQIRSGQSWSTANLWGDGVNPAAVKLATTQLMTVKGQSWTYYTGGNLYYGNNVNLSFGEILVFTATMEDSARQAVESRLMYKWGISDSYEILPPSSSLTVAAGATLDLGGLDQTVASLNLSGAITNGALTVTGAATFGEGATIDIGDADQDSWSFPCGSFSGEENLTVCANGVRVGYGKNKNGSLVIAKKGFVFIIAGERVDVGEDAGLTAWLEESSYTPTEEDELATANANGISPLAAYLLGYDSYNAKTTAAPTMTATVSGDSVTLSYDLTGKTTTPPTVDGIELSYAIMSADNIAFTDAASHSGTTLAFASAGLYNKLVASIAATE